MLQFLFTQTPLAFFVQSFWRDEAFSYLMAKRSLLEILPLAAKDFSPPLYYLILHFWILLFGKSELAIRSLSLLFYCGTIYIAYLFLTHILKLHGRKAALYLLLFIINPVLIWYAFEARMYAQFCFFAVLSFYAFYQRKTRLYVLATALGLYTHYFMAFVVFSQIIYTFMTVKSRAHRLAELKLVSLPVLIFIPWAIYMLTQKAVFSESFWILPVTRYDMLLIPGILFSGFERLYDAPSLNKSSFGLSLIALSVTLLAVILIGFMKLKQKDKELPKLFLYLLIWVGFPSIFVFVVSFFKPTFITRYLIFTTVGLVILSVYVMEQMKPAAKMLFFAFLIFFSLYFQKIELKYQIKSNFTTSTEEVAGLLKPGDAVYADILDFHTLEYYMGEDRVYLYGKTYDEIPNYIGKVLIPENKVKEALPYYPHKAFVFKNDGTYDIQALY